VNDSIAGRVYVWTRDAARGLEGRVTATVVPLPRLDGTDGRRRRLSGRHVSVRNGGALNERDGAAGQVRAVPIGDAVPNVDGDFLFEPGRGGGRMDKAALADPDFQWRYLQASHFGEVNTYFHLDRIAAYVDELLRALGAPSLPRVTAVVNAHHGVTEAAGVRDGLRREGRWVAFQGGHYRLPSRRYDVPEPTALSPDGEIHLGPGRQLLEHGALVEAAGGRYRANASHNAGILYHEYGHHLSRYTADFQANARRAPGDNSNIKSGLDEGMSDYWAATMLGTPHIWAWHRRHDDEQGHPRSLSSSKTMADYDHGAGADPHANGTIWAAALWDVRTRISTVDADGARATDLLVLQTLLRLGGLGASGTDTTLRQVCAARASYAHALAALLAADRELNGGRYRDVIVDVFARRGLRGAGAGADALMTSELV
jgi:hypothetical protein